ncbi:MAG TPA: hypothetical protein VJ570_06745 [Holophagaceae bacterium]|nr:hypothetical protein [Holophagaceae bacterium]
MHVVILSWKGGENDPFTPFNAALASYLEDGGKRTRTLQLTDPQWPSQLQDLAQDGIDFVFTHQGFGTNLTVGEHQVNLWEVLGVPLVIYHGDHPSHMPSHHVLDIRSCAHLYSTREFSLYASKHFRKRTRALVVPPPLFCLDLPLGERHGDYFVLAKNVTPTEETVDQWRANLDPRIFQVFMAGVETLTAALAQDAHVDTHGVLDDLLEAQGEAVVHPLANPDLFHLFHAHLDLFARNHVSLSVVEALRDVPLQVHGRGWTAQAKAGNPRHQFFRGRDLAHSQSLYYSNFGIVDVTPSMTGIHDRTLRALRNETPFLSSAHLPGFLPDMEAYEPLFYGFSGDDLREKAEAVMADPEGHAERARAFSHDYQRRAHPSEFVKTLDLIARTLDRR